MFPLIFEELCAICPADQGVLPLQQEDLFQPLAAAASIVHQAYKSLGREGVCPLMKGSSSSVGVSLSQRLSSALSEAHDANFKKQN